MPASFTNLLYHIVFSTKDREPLITEDRQSRLYEYIGGIIRKHGGIALEINGMPDHLHLLAKLRPDEALSSVMRDLKANSSGWMHKLFPDMRDFGWQNGYGAFTVSASELERVSRYIRLQQDHHLEMSFQDEYISLLRKHGIEFDERYLWK
jgi:putative transposase